MGYQALLFCPDEKTARTVTQVLSELEFNVESCTEPFAAVKKLMGQHFDAVVVDCDNEQNATLLFKSARNSTSNQASLAVAVVEGQAGVAKAFRIGANLVLTKPINIEQAKGTLRVARGLLRKSEPAKPGTPLAASSPMTPAAPKFENPAKPEISGPAAISTILVPNKAETSSAWPVAAAAASSSTSAQEEDPLDIEDDAAITPPAPVKKFITPSLQTDKFLAGAVSSSAPEVKAPAAPTPLSGGAASTPAPARERQDTRVADVSPDRSAEAEARSKVEAVQAGPSEAIGPVPTFTFGGANAPAESSGAAKKVFLGLAAAAIIAVAAYAGWTHFHGQASTPNSIDTETIAAPVTTSQPVKGVKPSAAATGIVKSSSPSSDSATSTPKGHVSDSVLQDDNSLGSKKDSGSDASKTDDVVDDAPAPLVVKGGKVPVARTKLGAADAPAPSMVGIAAAGATAPPPDLGSTPDITPKPILQTLNISQGVSRGLLYKKVQPVYPRNALDMRVEGSVELMATISKTGDISRVKVLSGDSQLSKAATDAVKQWKYKPYLLNGEPVEIQTQVTINFKLPK
ncbi:MAG TPA: TonB family protein [Candidatus Sulfotelmatobacter sp.]|nr:TonB family protein [Candidatus Sulfotelmatobacter sp.]